MDVLRKKESRDFSAHVLSRFVLIVSRSGDGLTHIPSRTNTLYHTDISYHITTPYHTNILTHQSFHLYFSLFKAAEDTSIHGANHPTGSVPPHRGGGGGKSSKRARAGSINKNDAYDRGLVLGMGQKHITPNSTSYHIKTITPSY